MPPRSKPETADKPNARGELTLPLGGQTYQLRPSHEAIEAIEAETGRSLRDLAVAARSNDLSLPECGLIAAHMMRAYALTHEGCDLHTDHKGAQPKVLSKLIFEESVLKVQPRLAIALIAALMGGVDATGEMKPATGNRPPAAG